MARTESRYSFGGDEHLFVEIDEEMSLEAFFKSLSVCTAIKEANIEGVTEICPANASFQIKFDPDVIAPADIEAEVKRIEARAQASHRIATRILEVPAYFRDPWTTETLMRFRDRHQDPDATDIEFAARINDYPSVDAFLAAFTGSPWFVSMVGFVAGLPFLYQMVERRRQIQVPKYLRPRTDTPALTIGFGGCFACIYSVRGAGGYQMFGITPMPIYDPQQKISYLQDFMCLFRPGDILVWKPIDREGYDSIKADVEAGRFVPKMAEVTFDLDAFERDVDGTNRKLLEALHA